MGMDRRKTKGRNSYVNFNSNQKFLLMVLILSMSFLSIVIGIMNPSVFVLDLEVFEVFKLSINAGFVMPVCNFPIVIKMM